MDYGKIFLAGIFLLVAAYIIIYVESPGAKLFGGGVLALLGLVTLIPALKEEAKAEAKKSRAIK